MSSVTQYETGGPEMVVTKHLSWTENEFKLQVSFCGRSYTRGDDALAKTEEDVTCRSCLRCMRTRDNRERLQYRQVS